MSPIPDELTATVISAVKSLTALQKAKFLLDHSLTLLETGQYGSVVEGHLDVYLRTPGLPKDDVAKALVARGRARRGAGQKLLMMASRDFQTASIFDPSSNRELQFYGRRESLAHFSSVAASQRVPPEIWDQIASFVPRYFLRTWLFVSPFHRDIALRRIFRTVDLYLCEDSDNWNRTLDIFDRVKTDPHFSRRIKVLRVHWAYDDGDMLGVMSRVFRSALPEFRALEEFEWIGYPELQADMVQVLLTSHPNLSKLGLIGWHFDAVGVSEFTSLKRFTLRAEDDDGIAEMDEVRSVLDNNANTLTHLTLGAYLARAHSWDSAFGSPTIQHLTHLELVDTRISPVVLARIAHAHNLVSLTLHGMLDQAAAATAIFGADHVPLSGGAGAKMTRSPKHVFLPHLESFRFALVGQGDDRALFEAVVQFLHARPRLRRLDLGNCPWELVRGLIPELVGLRALRVRIEGLTSAAVNALVRALPQEMQAIHLTCIASERLMHEYAPAFARFETLAMLHLHGSSIRRPQPSRMHGKELQLQTDTWLAHTRQVALAVPSIDYVGWHGEHFVVVRHHHRHHHNNHHHSNASGTCGTMVGGAASGACVELKELPVRRRLDCGKGVDLGSEDAMWMERKDVPIDYEKSGLDTVF
ncbi:hypothetical protein F5148DRAFT_1277868 [Russula earlei]|uniref:Uncharacterized protein n=1 Tax=Russula earlei TaxID=71964 RepID=A0ACC0TUZ5_9AGAM|nr:hypothetical protein F5148DRAFT_1277868 [Russula earlei]